MNKYLPSKRFTLILVSIVIALGIIYAFSLLNKTKKADTQLLLNTEAKAKVQEFMALDSDSDGLKDWEEALWKTDPKKPDTDNDGTNDANEITLNRDPLKQNINPPDQEPSDKIDPAIIANEKKIEEEYKNLTVTERISRELFSQYIANRTIDSPLSTTQQQQIIENTLSNLPTITFKVYTSKDIISSPLSDNDTLRIYSNQIAEAILNNLKIQNEDIGAIITDFSNINDDTKSTEQAIEIFKRFDPLIIKNEKMVNDLLKISVPSSLLNEHLALLNAFEEIYEGLNSIQKSAEDMILLIPLLNNYETSTQTLTEAFTKLINKILTLNITYTDQTDYGYQFFNVIIFRK